MEAVLCRVIMGDLMRKINLIKALKEGVSHSYIWSTREQLVQRQKSRDMQKGPSISKETTVIKLGKKGTEYEDKSSQTSQRPDHVRP